MKLVLDGVFNHMGRNAPIFQQAATADPHASGRGPPMTGSPSARSFRRRRSLVAASRTCPS
jgi:glycosidase